MNILIVYDSLYGNTQLVAQAIAKGFASAVPRMVHVREVNPEQLKDLDLLVIGSPTHGGNASKTMQQFFVQIKPGLLTDTKAAVFDTSIPVEGQGFFMRLILKLVGYASKRMARLLQKKGAVVIGQESFFVLGKKGPLKEGELHRAEAWGATLLNP